MQREFLLFSDCLLLLAPVEFHSWDWDWSWSGSGSGIGRNSVGTTDMICTRNKSEAEISSLKHGSKARVELVYLEVVVGSALEDEGRLEVLSPKGNFVVHAGKKYPSYFNF